MHRAAAEFPDEPRINGTEEEVALFGLFSRPFDGIQNPFDLRAGEVSVDDQARLFLEFVDQALFDQIFTNSRSLAGLPDDGVVNGTARRLIPYDSRFALVRKPKCRPPSGRSVPKRPS